MKKLLALFLVIVLLFSLTACGKSSIAPEVLEIQTDTDSHRSPHYAIPYDNETPAETLKGTSESKLEEQMWGIGGLGALGWSSGQTITWDQLQQLVGEGHACLRFQYGRYYAVAKMNDGSYLFLLFQKPNGNELLSIDSCFIRKLSSAKTANRIKTDALLEEVKEKVSCRWPEEKLPIYSETEDAFVGRFSDLTTRSYYFQNGKLAKVNILPAEDSVLTYLLPQDLALLS